MRLLYQHKKKRIEEHRYQINSGGTHQVKEHGEVLIRIVDGTLDTVEIPFEPPYTRNGLRILAAIESEVDSLLHPVTFAASDDA